MEEKTFHQFFDEQKDTLTKFKESEIGKCAISVNQVITFFDSKYPDWAFDISFKLRDKTAEEN